MKNFGLTAREAIAWIRICRAGSIIGPQQLYLVSYEEELQIKRQNQEREQQQLELEKRREQLFKYDVHEPEPRQETPNAETNLNSNSMMPLPSPPPPPKSARILFVPFKGCPIKNDDDEEDTGYNFIPKTSYSRNRKRNSKLRSNFGGRGETSQQNYRSKKSSLVNDQRFFGANGLPINMIHPQPRKVAQKQPYWKTIGSFA